MWSWGEGTLEMCWRMKKNGGGSCEKEVKSQDMNQEKEEE